MTETDTRATGTARPTPEGAVRFLATGDEAGTAPEDRPFRPDVEGLRAIAVALVVLYHVGVPHLGGGYVGVDVFFVISGFVITGLLLRERQASDRTSLLAFYGRRSRRIIPAAALVIAVTVIATRILLGVVSTAQVVSDARWATLFLANFHFTATGTNYFLAQGPVSPLQSFWSLAVEEQFYIVYPTIFLVLAVLARRTALRTKLVTFLVLAAAASFTWSVVQTSSNPTVAYFSPFTRAWELALGGIVAAGAPWLRRIPPGVAGALTWAGMGGILASALAFTNTTPYPGSLVALPVVATALVIAGGTAVPARGAELVLARAPLRWLGKWSYSLYLWHWPVLVVAAQYEGRQTLSVSQNLMLALLALALSVITYFLLENPVRHARLLRRVRFASVGTGAAVTAACIGVVSLVAPSASASANAAVPGSGGLAPATPEAVTQAVAASRAITRVPASVTPSLQEAPNDWGGLPADAAGCEAHLAETTVPACVFGDPAGTHTMVLYGDSHALMWFEAFDAVAQHAGWRLVVLGKDWCHPALVARTNPPGYGRPGGRYTPCDTWHAYAARRIAALHPDMLVVTEMPGGQVYPSGTLTKARWEQGLAQALAQLASPKTHQVVLGNIPITPHIDPGCLARHADAVQACSALPGPFYRSMAEAETAAASVAGAQYIDVTPWFCSTTCADIIDGIVVYKDSDHVTATYSRYLESVLSISLGFGPIT